MQRKQAVRGVGSAVAVLALTCPAMAAAATPDGSAELTLGGKAADRLAAAEVRITAGGAADASAGRITLPVTGVRIAAAARLDHGGSLTFRKGKRAVALHGLRTTLGRGAGLTAAVDGKRIAFLSLQAARSRPVSIDAASGVAIGRRLTATLTRAGARTLRKALKVKRLGAGRFGTLTASGRLVADDVAPGGAPPAPPAPQPPAPQPQPSPTPTPDPNEPEPDPVIGHTDWIASTLPGSSDLKSFTNYLLRSWPAVPPATESGPGSVIASNGAARIDAANPYDHRLDILAADRAADGSVHIEHHGQIDYELPAHSIDNRFADPEVVIAPGGASAAVLADGHVTSMATAGAPPEPFTDEHVLDLDLAGIAPELGAGGTRTWRDVPAVVAATGQEETGYAPGSAWGSWTITVPAAGTEPGPATVTGTSSFAAYPSWIAYVKTVPPGGSVVTSGGTTEGDSGVFAAPVSGTFDFASGAGTADLAGAIQYLKPAHGIDLTFADSRVTVDGAASTVSAAVTFNGSALGRVEMATVDLSAPDAVTADGVTWTARPAVLTAAGAGAFGSYAPGDPYGTLTLTLDAP